MRPSIAEATRLRKTSYNPVLVNLTDKENFLSTSFSRISSFVRIKFSNAAASINDYAPKGKGKNTFVGRIYLKMFADIIVVTLFEAFVMYRKYDLTSIIG